MNVADSGMPTDRAASVGVVYDDADGYLAVPLEALLHLGVLVSGARGIAKLPAAIVDALTHAGAIGPDGEVAPLLSAVAEVVDRALVEIDVELATSEGLAVAAGVVSTGGGLVAFPAAARGTDDSDGAAKTDDPELAELVLTPAGEVPYRIGELLDVTARPHTGAPPVTLPGGVIDELLAADPDEAVAAVDEVFGAPGLLAAPACDALTHLLLTVRAHWTVTARVATSDVEVVERRHEVVDGGAAGWWFVVRDDRRDVLAPTTGRGVMEALESLLPTDDELRSFLGDSQPAEPALPTRTPSWPVHPATQTATTHG